MFKFQRQDFYQLSLKVFYSALCEQLSLQFDNLLSFTDKDLETAKPWPAFQSPALLTTWFRSNVLTDF